MKKSTEIRSLIDSKIDELTKLVGNEERSLSDEEKTKFDTLKSEIDVLKADEKRAKDLEEMRLDAAENEKRRLDIANAAGGGEGSNKEERKIKKEFNILSFISESSGRCLTGLNKEIHEEAEKEAREAGLELKGDGIPSFLLRNEKRDHVAATNTKGGYTIETELKGVFEYLDDALVLPSLGTTYMRDLKGNLEFDDEDNTQIATFKAENSTSDEQSYTWGQKTMTPKRLPAWAGISTQLLTQSSIGVQNRVAQRIGTSIGLGIQNAAINGSGTAPVPRGILNTVGIGSTAIGTNGGALTWDAVVKLAELIDLPNALIGSLGFLTNKKVHSHLQTTPKALSTDVFLIENSQALLNSYAIAYSNQVKGDLTKGTGTNLSTLIFGNWNDLMIGQWGGMDMIVDPYSRKKDGVVEIAVNTYWDVLVARAQSFAAILDIDTSA